jgi:plastocyanin
MIILENRDDIEHGFASSLFEEHPVQIEAGGVVTFGNSVKTVHIGSGKTVRIHFQPNRPGRFRFQCDIHPDMKGELLLLSVGTI